MGNGSSGRSSNDQRSDAKNSNSCEYKDAQDNRSVQLNQNNSEKDSDDDEE
jgi:hypothetical protein